MTKIRAFSVLLWEYTFSIKKLNERRRNTETREKNMKLNDFRLLVNDFPSSFHFWHEIVDLPVVFRDENNIYAELDAGNVRLELLDASYFAASVGAVQPTPVQEGYRGVIVFEVDDLEAAYADLIKRGAPSLAQPHDHPAGFARVALLTAPDGYVLELFKSRGHFPG
jgi:lactoylglutathione lyase